jgi:hypothetical protein
MTNNTRTRNSAGFTTALAALLLASCTIPPDYVSDTPLVAPIIPTMPGYVYSPYLDRPRIIDAQDGAAGSLMICPYTGVPFVMPGTFTFVPRESFTHPPAEERIAQSRGTQGPVIVNRTASISAPSKTVYVATYESLPTKSIPAATKPKQDVPFGTPVPGRAGFVYSPYADKDGLVDVQGMSSGMPVRCPFTGKLFRVP